MLVDSKTIATGMKIKFTTINSKDGTEYEGVVQGIDLTNDIAKTYFEVYNYNKQIQATTPTVDEVEDMRFFIIRLDNGTILPFSADWITESSLTIIDTTNYLDFRIYNVSGDDASTIKTLLNDNGYTVKQQ